MFFLNILIHYIVPIIYDSLVSLIIVLAILFIFRIKDSDIRILFLFLPLAKPFLVILERVDVNELYFSSRTGASGMRFPDPAGIIKTFESFDRGALFISDPNYIFLIITISAIAVFLIIRWISIAFFYKNLAYEERVGREDVPQLYKMIDSFTKKIKTRIPDISLTHKPYLSPFVVGVKRVTMVMSPVFLEMLNNNEKETMLQHELSHIKRNDNLIGWISLILRDINFFNPFGYIAYSLIRSEQEVACDKMVLAYSGKSRDEIANNLLNSLLKLKDSFKSKDKKTPREFYTFSPTRILNERKLTSRIDTIVRTDPKKIRMRIFPKILSYFLFIILFLIQIIFLFKINDIIIFLR